MPNAPITVIFELNLLPAIENAPTLARLSLDASGDSQFQPKEEVPLASHDGGKTWRGMAVLNRPTTGTKFNVRFVAPLGTKWHFNARTVDGRTVYPDQSHDGQIGVTITSEEESVGVLL